jgi:hypothetical protein
MISIIFLEILKAMCSFKKLTDFCDCDGIDVDKLTNFMKTDCLQTALTHNKPDEIKKHVLNLMAEGGKTLTSGETDSVCEMDIVLPIIRTLTLTTPEDKQRLLDYFLKENAEKQKEFINYLIALHGKRKEGRIKLTDDRKGEEQYQCPTRAFLAKLGFFNNEKEHQGVFAKKLENSQLENDH